MFETRKRYGEPETDKCYSKLKLSKMSKKSPF